MLQALRDSHEPDAVLKDFVLGEFDTCGEITINKLTSPTGDTTTNFDFADGESGFTLMEGLSNRGAIQR